MLWQRFRRCLLPRFLLGSLVLKKSGDLTTNQNSIGDVQGYGSPHLALMAAVGVLMVLIILGFAYVAKTILPGRNLRLVIAASVLPLALLFIDALLCKYWDRIKELRVTLAERGPQPRNLRSLNFFLAVLPVSIVAGISFFKPIFVPRGTLIFVPFLLICPCNWIGKSDTAGSPMGLLWH